jgi:hypothetical protein
MNPKKIDIIDYVVMSIYISIGIFICISYEFALLDQKYINGILSGFTFIGPLLLFNLYYKRFQIIVVWLIWIIIGVLQAIYVLALRKNVDFDAVNGSYADLGWSLLILLIMIAIFRFINIKFFNQEFMLVTRFSDTSERKTTAIDYIFSFLGLMILCLGVPLISKL